MLYLLLLTLVLALPGAAIAVGVAVTRAGFGVLGVALMLAIGVNALSVYGWMLSGMSEYPDNSVGHPDRVHVTNVATASDGEVALAFSDPTDPDADGAVRDLRPGVPMVIPGSFHPARTGDVCLDRPVWLVASGPDSVRTVVELDRCRPRGEHVLQWDGDQLVADPSWRPPLIHPDHEPLAVGGAIASAVFGLGVAAQTVRRRRHHG